MIRRKYTKDALEDMKHAHFFEEAIGDGSFRRALRDGGKPEKKEKESAEKK